MRKIILGALVAIVLVACAKEEASIAKIEEVKNPYAVTTDEAVQLLQTVIGGESTRAISVGEIKTLRKSDFVPTTRGADDGDLIYIVDLENGGSAIMGADKRMEPIYAILDETKVSPEQLTLTATRSDDGEQDIEEYVMGLVNNKIQVDVMGFEHTFPEMPIVPRPQYVTVTTTLDFNTPILDTKWGWTAPYSNMYPSGTPCNDNSIIAIAQLLYFHRQPNTLGTYSLNWDLIAECEHGQTPSISAQNEVAKLFYALDQNGCNVSGMENHEVTQFLRNVGFAATTFSAYGIPFRPNIVKEQIDQNKLVLGYGATMNNNVKRYWLFDGYKFYQEDVYYRVYDPMGSGTYTDTLESSTIYNLCHCNFGCLGVCDGYYPMDIFDLSTQLANKNLDNRNGDIAGSQAGVILNNNLMTSTY